MKDIEEIEAEQSKRDTLKRTEGDALYAECRNRSIGDSEFTVKLSITLLFPGAAAIPDYIIDPAIKHTLIRVQDDARRTMNQAEIEALDGTTINAQEFWAQRRDRKARTVKPITFEKAQAAVAKGTPEQQAALLKQLLAANPELAALLK